jgi:putative oxidoreductase
VADTRGEYDMEAAMHDAVLSDLGLALIRVPAGLLLMGHGAQKLFGWFGGGGPEATGKGFAGLGYPRAREMAILAGLTEFAAGGGLALGFLTPLVAAGIIGVMINAIVSVHWRAGVWAQNGGLEYPLVLATLAAGIALRGPGRISIDNIYGFGRPAYGWGLAAIVVGIVTSVLALASRRREPVPSGQ